MKTRVKAREMRVNEQGVQKIQRLGSGRRFVSREQRHSGQGSLYSLFFSHQSLRLGSQKQLANNYVFRVA